MNKQQYCRVVLLFCLFFIDSKAFATSILVGNSSFEINNGFNIPCGGSCEYSTNTPIPDWNMTGNGLAGQFITGGYAGNPSAIDGNVIAYTDAASISQTVGTVSAGATYTLQVDLLHRTDLPLAGIIQLEVGNNIVATATGTDGGAGTWSNWTATFTANASEAGQALSILLSSSGQQGDFDNVRLDATNLPVSVPEPSSILLLVSGLFGLIGYKRR